MVEVKELDPDDKSQAEEEQGFIHDSLEHMTKVFSNLQLRENALPTGSKLELKQFKEAWRNFFNSEIIIEDNINNVDQHSTNVAGTQQSQGAVPKRKSPPPVMRVSESRNSESINDSSSSNSCSSADSSLASSDLVLRKPGTSRRARNGNNPEHGKVHRFLSQFDTRQVPSFGEFEEDSGEKLTAYLRKFESYCENNFKGDRDTWIPELQKRLTGNCLQAFRSLRNNNDSYDVAKEKLCNWYSDLKDIRKEKYKQEFRKAKCPKEESMFLFSSRLSSLFRLAYPSRRIDNSRTLREKYVNAVPSDFRKILESRIMSQAVRGKTMSWTKIQSYARLYDLERQRGNNRDNADQPDQHTMNYAGSLKKTDASTQCERQQKQSLIFPRDDAASPRKPWYRELKRDPVRSDAECFHCGRLGHMAKDCRLRNGQCFRCGSPEHFMSRCPVAGGTRSGRRMPRSSSQPAMRDANRQRPPRNNATAPLPRQAADDARYALRAPVSHREFLNREAPTRQR